MSPTELRKAAGNVEHNYGNHPDVVSLIAVTRSYADLIDMGYEADYCEEHDQLAPFGAKDHRSPYPPESCRWSKRFVGRLGVADGGVQP